MKKEPDTLYVGDVVVLKSGGPHMTVYGFAEEDATAKCVWFTLDQIPRYGEFPELLLQRVRP